MYKHVINVSQRASLVFFLLLGCASSTLWASNSIQKCDQLAANPEDLERKAPGVSWGNMNAAAAIRACSEAIKQSPGLPRIQYQFARSLHKGEQFQEALRIYHELSEKDYVSAQTGIAWMYLNGQGVAKDDTEALKWYRKAAEQGSAQAQNSLGWMYENGRGVAKDDTEALKWYRKAAEQGHASAQSNLGSMYANGHGKAAEQGDPVMEIDLPPGDKVENGLVVRFTVKFPTPLNNRDVFSITNNGVKVIRMEIDGDLSVTEFSSRMMLLVSSKLEFSLARNGETKTIINNWKPGYIAPVAPRLGDKELGKIKKKVGATGIKVMVSHNSGFISYTEILNVKTTKGAVKFELTPLISRNPFVGIKSTHKLEKTDLVVNAHLSRTPFIAGKQFLIDTKSLYEKMRDRFLRKGKNEGAAQFNISIKNIDEIIRSLDEYAAR